MDPFSHLPLQEMIGLRGSGGVCDETLLGAFAPKMVERQVGGDPPRPGREVTLRPETVARPVNPPEGFYRQIFRDTGVTHDAHDPRVDLALKLPDQCLERIDLAKRKSTEQIHGPLYSLLRRRTDWVTRFSEVRRTTGGRANRKGCDSFRFADFARTSSVCRQDSD